MSTPPAHLAAAEVAQMRRRFAVSQLVQRFILVAVLVGYPCLLLPSAPLASAAAVLLSLGLIALAPAAYLSIGTTRAANEVARLMAMNAPAEHVEPRLNAALSRFTLYRAVRVMLYHHLARLRLRQGRFDEASTLCAALLDAPAPPPAPPLRHALLLIFAEARLREGDARGAFGPLLALHQAESRLSLLDRSYALALRLRYETTCGHDEQALAGLEAKLSLLDLMPPPIAAAAQVWLATSARRTGRNELASLLSERATLLVGDRIATDVESFDSTTHEAPI